LSLLFTENVCAGEQAAFSDVLVDGVGQIQQEIGKSAIAQNFQRGCNRFALSLLRLHLCGVACRSSLQKLMDQRLIRLVVQTSHSPKARQQFRIDTNRNHLFCMSRTRAANTAGASQFLIG